MVVVLYYSCFLLRFCRLCRCCYITDATVVGVAAAVVVVSGVGSEFAPARLI